VVRAQKRKWMDLVAGLLVGAATQPLALLAGPESDVAAHPAMSHEREVAQFAGGSTRTRAAINAAIDAERNGDLDKAASLYHQAMERANELSPEERRELERRVAANGLALKARTQAREHLGLAEAAFQHNRKSDAAVLVNKITVNEVYLSPADKQRFQSLCQRLHLQANAPAPGGGVAAAADGHAKLQQARAALAQSDLDAAEQLLGEVERLGVTFGPQDDSPRKVREDIERVRRDAKRMLAASRVALQHRNFDRAEQYARVADKLASPFTFVMGDTPAKVLKEIQTERMNAPLSEQKHDKGMQTAMDSAPSSSPNTEKARSLIRQGRQALARQDVEQARKYAEEANALKPDLHWSDDTPSRLLEDIAKVSPAASKTATVTATSAGGAIKNKEEALALLAQGRELLTKGQLEEANQISARLRAASNIRWGLFFEDTPDKLQSDISAARTKRDKEQSVQLLAEGRRLFQAKDYDGAEKMAYQAKTKHGNYSIWDFGDTPSKLLADVQSARQKEHIIKLPDEPKSSNQVADLSHGPLAQSGNNAVAQNNKFNDRGGPTTPYNTSSAGNAAEARRIVQDARLALNNGKLLQARQLADRARDLRVAFAPNEDSPEKIYRDLESKSSLSPAGKELGSTRLVSNTQPTETRNGQSAMQWPKNSQEGGAQSKDRVDPLSAQSRVRQLIVEARALQQQNRLIEAREKITEAQAMGTAPRPGEESPNQVYQQLVFVARQRIDNLVLRANEVLRYGTQANQTRCQQAENDLAQAAQLAAAFGLDSQPVESARRLAMQLRSSGGNALAAAPQLNNSIMPTGKFDRGMTPGVKPSGPSTQQLLDQARLELRSGQTANARHLAEEAVKAGAGEAGLAVLRTVDAEEEAQAKLRANRTFDEVVQAYRLRDYRRASLMLAAVDTPKLDAKRQARLREMLATPEMQPNARGSGIALTSAQQPTTSNKNSGDAGHARVTDDPGQSLIARTRAMREIKFQQLRSEGLNVQSQALERFRSGQTDVAEEMLQEHLARLAEEQLDPGQLALLRRPIDSRLQQFRLLKQQSELVNNRFDEKSQSVKKDLLKAKSAEQLKQKNVAQLMKQYNELFARAKYSEAELVALKVKELDPDNPMATGAITMAKLHRNQSEYQKDKDEREKLFIDTQHDLDNVDGAAEAVSKGIAFTKDAERLETIRNRDRDHKLDGVLPYHESDAERNIKRKLMESACLSFSNKTLREAIDYVRGVHGINIFVDEPALAEKNITLDAPVTIKLDHIALKSGLKLLLRTVHLTYVVSDDVLKITTEDQARGKLQRRVYQVPDLVIAVENYGQVGTTPVPDLGLVNVNQAMNTPSSPMTGMTAMQGGQGVGMPSSGSMANPNSGFAADPSGNPVQVTKHRAQTHEDMLIKLITSTVEPRSWADQGGPGTIDFHPLTNALVINQTPDIQDQIQDLLNALRRMIDQEVAVEVKFISIAEDFFERIGVNFNMNIVNKNRQALQYQPELTSGQFAQPGYINVFQPSNFISGLTPAGTLTNDLNIPITNTTFPQAIPPFGGYPGVPGFGGLTLGLAFLSDIQVFLFMEAVQGDYRSNVMQAPKLTLFNGQTATLSVSDFQFFTIGVNITNGGFGQLIYNPLTTMAPLGTNLFMQAVISGDRRFVRLSLQPSMTNLVNGEVNLFPVVTPIFPLFDGTATGQPVVFTQFVQQPHITRVFVQTTVAVPDGGTVLMGGLKRLSEGRNEFGPPVIGKIPYLSRLFRNIGYGRSAESLLIMVTPRIIIQAEEEEKQTNYTPPAAATSF
jgi:type II secretory pathway component GspD/PulD (secretin)